MQEIISPIPDYEGELNINEIGNASTNENPLRNKPVMKDFFYSDKNLEKKEGDKFKNIDSKTLKFVWHYKHGHLPFSTDDWMAAAG